MAVSKFQHEFDTWVYPRVYHFQRRFLDVHRRFTNVISKFLAHLDKANYPAPERPSTLFLTTLHYRIELWESFC